MDITLVSLFFEVAENICSIRERSGNQKYRDEEEEEEEWLYEKYLDINMKICVVLIHRAAVNIWV